MFQQNDKGTLIFIATRFGIRGVFHDDLQRSLNRNSKIYILSTFSILYASVKRFFIFFFFTKFIR